MTDLRRAGRGLPRSRRAAALALHARRRSPRCSGSSRRPRDRPRALAVLSVRHVDPEPPERPAPTPPSRTLRPGRRAQHPPLLGRLPRYETGRGEALSAALVGAAVAAGLTEREARGTVASAPAVPRLLRDERDREPVVALGADRLDRGGAHPRLGARSVRSTRRTPCTRRVGRCPRRPPHRRGRRCRRRSGCRAGRASAPSRSRPRCSACRRR